MDRRDAGNQHIPCSEVAVEQSLTGKFAHCIAYLLAHLKLGHEVQGLVLGGHQQLVQAAIGDKLHDHEFVAMVIPRPPIELHQIWVSSEPLHDACLCSHPTLLHPCDGHRCTPPSAKVHCLATSTSNLLLDFQCVEIHLEPADQTHELPYAQPALPRQSHGLHWGWSMDHAEVASACQSLGSSNCARRFGGRSIPSMQIFLARTSKVSMRSLWRLPPMSFWQKAAMSV
mmetsp:Transcript_11062/g.28357  ORF Transcript_11062/g.28357 Transcript_11062/m.28357 type:complete len:228 (-) Transcript_11062:635-1318(-)